MPDENQTIVVPTQRTVETIDTNGNSLPRNGNLSSIFDKIESGQSSKEAVKEVMAKPRAEKPKEEVKPANETPEAPKEAKEIKVTSSHTEEKPEQKPTSLTESLNRSRDKKSEGDTPPPVEEDIVEDDLKVLPADKPKTAKRISALLKKVTEVTEREAATVKEKQAQADELKALKEQLGSVKTLDPKVEQEIAEAQKELKMFRRRFELDKDPEVKSKYDARIEQADNSIPDILKKNSAGDGLINLIKEEGGWAKFSTSDRLVTLADGSKLTTAELADQIVSALPFNDRKTVDSLSMEQISLKREKDRYLEAEIKRADEYFKEKEQSVNKGSEEYAKQIKLAEKTIKDWQDKVALENSFLKEKEIPANATSDQKKEIEAENANAKELNETLKKNLNTKDLDGMLSIVLDATKFHQEKRVREKLTSDNAKLKADLKAKSDELDRFKEAGRTVAKPGSLKAGGSSAPSAKPEKAETLTEALNRLQEAKGRGDE